MSRLGFLLGSLPLVLIVAACCSPTMRGAPGERSPARDAAAGAADGRARPPRLDAGPSPDSAPAPDAGARADAGEVAAAEIDAAPPPPPIEIEPSAYARATVPIEDPQGAMDHFYERLAAVARDEEGVLARIGLYSDSVNGTEFVSSGLRHLMAERFGDGGKGWVPVGKGWPTQHHWDVEWRYSGTWLTQMVNRGNAEGDRYGLGGVVSYNRSRHSHAVYRTMDEGPVNREVARFRLFYQAWPQGGVVQVAVDGGEPIEIATASEEIEDRVFDLRVDEGPHELEVSVGEGRLRLYGVVMERRGPGVVVDGLMLIGARARRLVLFDDEHFGRQLALREMDLVIFWMGGNDAESRWYDREGFVEDYSAGIAAARRGHPEMSCLVSSIMDMGEPSGGRTRRRVPRIVELQREIALEQGCAFFNLFEAVGGEGTARRWFRATPRLISGDYIHPTREGSYEIAQIFYQTLLRGLAEHLGIAEPVEAPPEADAGTPDAGAP